MASHLSTCNNIPAEVKLMAQAHGRKENTGPKLSRNQQIARSVVLAQSRSDSAYIDPVIDPNITLNVPYIHSDLPRPFPTSLTPVLPTYLGNQIAMWDPLKQEEFASDLCKVFISCNFAWNAAANPQLLLFFSKYVPEAKIPDRRVLSGRVLNR